MSTTSELIPQEIIHKAFERAFGNGFVLKSNVEVIDRPVLWRVRLQDQVRGTGTVVLLDVAEEKGENPQTFTFSLESLLFNHEFAKAIWGTKPCWLGFNPLVGWPGLIDVSEEIEPWYLWNVKQMAAATDRIKFLGEHL